MPKLIREKAQAKNSLSEVHENGWRHPIKLERKGKDEGVAPSPEKGILAEGEGYLGTLE